jgi:TRAP-type mannitol/chloroaromatic compound transport system permease large subunit
VLLSQIFGGCMPFMYIVIVCMALIYIFPGIATWLPDLLYSH